MGAFEGGNIHEPIFCIFRKLNKTFHGQRIPSTVTLTKPSRFIMLVIQFWDLFYWFNYPCCLICNFQLMALDFLYVNFGFPTQGLSGHCKNTWACWPQIISDPIGSSLHWCIGRIFVGKHNCKRVLYEEKHAISGLKVKLLDEEKNPLQHRM